jgi:ABC-type branched-subunit amino acid transport system substrate-binding protein
VTPRAGPALLAPGASGRGYTATELYVGYLTWKDVSNVGKTVGYAVDYGDEDAQPKAIVDDINAHGGIAGRKVVLVFYDYESSDVAANGAQGDQKACTRFTEDRPTFAVVAVTGILTDVLPECLAKHQTILIANTNVAYPQAQFNRLAPYFYANASPTIERFIPAWLQRASALKYFSGWDTLQGQPGAAPVKVGVLGDSSPLGQTITKLIKAELARGGHPAAETFEVSSALDANGMNAAVLRFKAANVTHVVSGILDLLIFPQTAEAQHYRPRYAVSSFHAPILLQAAVPPQQLAGALGAGYYPTSDVDTGHDPGDISSFETHCRQVERNAGQDTSQREAFNFMVKACDGFALLGEAISRGGLSVNGVRQGIGSIQAMPPAGTFAISFAGGQLSGVAAVRDLGYNTDCDCFVYLNKADHSM